jgi:hypothetical protein
MSPATTDRPPTRQSGSAHAALGAVLGEVGVVTIAPAMRLRRSSGLTVDATRPIRRAISRTDNPWQGLASVRG